MSESRRCRVYQKLSAAAVKTDGSLWTWGNNVDGRLGFANISEEEYRQLTPRKIMDGVAAASASVQGVLAIKTDGTLWVWGSNHRANDTQASYGLQNISCQSVPVKFCQNVKQAAVGGCVTIKPDGTVWTWKNADSQYELVKRGYHDIKLTDIITPVAASSGTASGTADRFEDVHTTDYFYDAVNWAVEKGITSGKSETRFAPYDTCTGRSQNNI